MRDTEWQALAHNQRGDRVVLTNIHSSKGREFWRVIIAGVHKGILPWQYHENDMHFRRLFYVACTRATHNLHFVYSVNGRYEKSPYIQDVRNAVKAFDQESRQMSQC